jgi:hypothetical protein
MLASSLLSFIISKTHIIRFVIGLRWLFNESTFLENGAGGFKNTVTQIY